MKRLTRLGLLLAASAGLLGCVPQQARRELDAAKAELAQLRELIAKMPEDVRQKEQQAEHKHAKRIDAEPARLRTTLENWTDDACGGVAKSHAQKWPTFAKDIAQAAKALEAHTEQAAGQQKTHRTRELAGIRAQLGPLRDQARALPQRRRGERDAAFNSQLSKARADLKQDSAVLATQATRLRNELTRLAQALEGLQPKTGPQRPKR